MERGATNKMKLIEEILSEENLEEATKRVKANKGVAGVDKMTVDQIDVYFEEHGKEIKDRIMNKKYKPQLVKRVYIPKANGKLRLLGIPVVVDRVIQQVIVQKLIPIYENLNKINIKFKNGFNEEEIIKVANSRLGWYKRCSMNVVNFILNPKVLNIKTKERPGLVNPLEYYLNSL